MGISKGYVSGTRGRRPLRGSHHPQANILVDHDGHAYLADFGLLAVVSDQSTSIFQSTGGGTIQWMSPELLDPDSFGLKGTRPTKESDCYALGMVVYEVLSGHTPFAPYAAPVVIRMVLEGKRPGRPQGEEGKVFTDAIWEVLKLSWKHRPSDRTSVTAVLRSLEGNPSPVGRASYMDGDAETDTDYHSDATGKNYRMFPRFISGLPLMNLVVRTADYLW